MNIKKGNIDDNGRIQNGIAKIQQCMVKTSVAVVPTGVIFTRIETSSLRVLTFPF